MNPWSVFWRQGHSTTIGDYLKQGYDGAVADWWQVHVDAMAPGSVVLEVACGNCSLLPALARSGKPGRYIGVDLASVEISEVARKELESSALDVVVHTETPAEEIPEADASVDTVVSVFGVEYSDINRSLDEIRRVLKPGGRFLALIHHDASIVTTMSRRAVSEYVEDDIRALIDALRTISKARDETPDLSQLKNNAEAESARATINELAGQYLGDTNPDTANATMFELMSNALKFFKMMGQDTAKRAEFIESLAEEHAASRDRFAQMVSVALDDCGARDLEVKLADLGFDATRVDVIHSNEDILAWELYTEKPQPH
jgi:ubiquinone/menaquinone biosynthesis C-methylase UbiE